MNFSSTHSNRLAPFEDDYIDVDGEYSQFQTLAVFFVALLLKTGKILRLRHLKKNFLAEAIPQSEVVLDVLLVVIICSMVLLSPFRMLQQYLERYQIYKKYLGAAAFSTFDSDFEIGGYQAEPNRGILLVDFTTKGLE